MMPEPDTWQRVDDLFAQTIDLPPGERATFLRKACTDARVRAEVESLVASAGDAHTWLGGAVSATATAMAVDRTSGHVGQRLGAYRVVDVLGEGGMGTVYRAERDDAAYRHIVAIKLMQHGLASPQVIARFRDERQILATLDHPAIVRLLDGGTTDDGLPYLVMEYIEGVPLARHARGRPVRARVELVRRICDALQYAHQRLVVHRDIKPSNVLVTADGSPKLLDFGIAKLLEPTATTDREAKTRTGLALFTPEYASPEQARGHPVGVATDVYSTGAVLYELLAGCPPHPTSDSVLDTLRTICEVDPPRPSTVAPDSRREIAGDLDNIVLKALQKDPARRYGSIAEFADDLDRYLGGRPVRAREATFGYRARKFVGRNRGALALTTLVALALTTATVVSIVQARRAAQSEREALRLARTSLAEQGRQELVAEHPGRALPSLIEAWKMGEDTPALRFLVAEAMRPFQREQARIRDFDGGVSDIAWAPDGARFAAAGFYGRVRLYDAAGAPIANFDVPESIHFRSLQFSGDGDRLVAGGSDGVVRVWAVATSAVLYAIPAHRAIVQAIAFVGNDHLLTCGYDDATRLWHLPTASLEVEVVETGRVTGCAASSDGARLFTGTEDGVVTEWDLRTGALARELPAHDGSIGAMRLSADGARLYVVGGSHARIWDVPLVRTIATLSNHMGEAIGLDLSRDGHHLVTTGRGGTVKLWDARTGAFVADGGGHPDVDVTGAKFSPDGERVVTTSRDNTFRIVDAATGAPELALETAPVPGSAPHSHGGSLDAQFSPDGTHVLSSAGAEVQLWRADRAPLRLDIRTGDRALDRPLGGALSPAHDRVAGVGDPGVAAVWRLDDGARVATLDVGDTTLWDASWSPDGTTIAVAGDNAYAALFPAGGGTSLRSLDGHQGGITCVEHRPDGALLVTCGDDHTARLWDHTGTPVRTLSHPNRVMSAAWSRDGARLVTAGWDGVLRVWDVATGAIATEVRGGTTQFLSVTFIPDEHGLIAGGHEGAVTEWDLATGARRRTFEGHTGPVTWIGFSPDGGLLATTADDMTARIWDPHTGKQLATHVHPGSVMFGLWVGSDRLATICTSKHIRLWDVARVAGDVVEAAAFVEQHVPWQLVDGRIERRELTQPD